MARKGSNPEQLLLSCVGKPGTYTYIGHTIISPTDLQ